METTICEQFEMQMADALKGRLEGAQAVAFFEHLKGCAECNHEYQAFQGTATVLDLACPKDSTRQDDVWNRIQKTLTTVEQKQSGGIGSPTNLQENPPYGREERNQQSRMQPPAKLHFGPLMVAAGFAAMVAVFLLSSDGLIPRTPSSPQVAESILPIDNKLAFEVEKMAPSTDFHIAESKRPLKEKKVVGDKLIIATPRHPRSRPIKPIAPDTIPPTHATANPRTFTSSPQPNMSGQNANATVTTASKVLPPEKPKKVDVAQSKMDDDVPQNPKVVSAPPGLKNEKSKARPKRSVIDDALGLAIQRKTGPLAWYDAKSYAWRSAVAGERIPYGAKIRTGSHTLAELAFGESRLRLDQGTELTVTRKVDKTRVAELNNGRLIIDLLRSDAGFEIEAQGGQVALTGTVVEVNAPAPGLAFAWIHEGSVDVLSRTGKDAQPLTLKASQGDQVLLSMTAVDEVINELSKPVQAQAKLLAKTEGRIISRKAETLHANWTNALDDHRDNAEASVGHLIVKDQNGKQAEPLTLASLDIRANIRGPMAITQVDHVFYNATAQVLEGTFYFPLPPGAAISRFAMYVDSEQKVKIEGEVVERKKARAVYESILRQRRDPALLEWMEGNIFKARIFPIPAHSEKRVILEYTELLPAEMETRRYVIPLVNELTQKHAIGRLGISIKLESETDQPFQQIFSPSYYNETKVVGIGTSTATATLELTNLKPAADFVLTMTAKRSSNFESKIYAGKDEQPFVLIGYQPQPSSKAFDSASKLPKVEWKGNEAGRDILFVTETSGRRSPKELYAQGQVLNAMLAGLNATRDRVAITAGDTTLVPLTKGFLPVFSQKLNLAIKQLSQRPPLGAQDLQRCLYSASSFFKAHARDKRQRILVYLGSGIAAFGEMDSGKLIANASSNLKEAKVRFMAVSIGRAMDTLVLSGLARNTNGFFAPLSLDADLEAEAFHLALSLNSALLDQPSLNVQDNMLVKMYPTHSGSLLPGREAFWTGRLLKEAKDQKHLSCSMTGQFEGKTITDQGRLILPENWEQHPAVGRFWARARLDALIAQPETRERRDEIIDLAQTWTLMSPHTSFLVLESEQDYKRYSIDRRKRRPVWRDLPASFSLADQPRFITTAKDQREASPNLEAKEEELGIELKGRSSLLARIRKWRPTLLGQEAGLSRKKNIFNRTFKLTQSASTNASEPEEEQKKRVEKLVNMDDLKLLIKELSSRPELKEEVDRQAYVRLRSGKRHFESKRYEHARDDSEQVLLLKPDNPAAKDLLKQIISKEMVSESFAKMNQIQKFQHELSETLVLALKSSKRAEQDSKLSAAVRIRTYEETLNHLKRAKDLANWLPPGPNDDQQKELITQRMKIVRAAIKKSQVELVNENKDRARELDPKRREMKEAFLSKQIAPMVDQAKALFHAGKYEEAEALATKILEVSPTHSIATAIEVISRDRTKLVARGQIDDKLLKTLVKEEAQRREFERNNITTPEQNIETEELRQRIHRVSRDLPSVPKEEGESENEIDGDVITLQRELENTQDLLTRLSEDKRQVEEDLALQTKRILGFLENGVTKGVSFGQDRVSQSEYEQLKSEVAGLRQKLATQAPVASSSAVDQVLENRYGPNSDLTARQRKLAYEGFSKAPQSDKSDSPDNGWRVTRNGRKYRTNSTPEGSQNEAAPRRNSKYGLFPIGGGPGLATPLPKIGNKSQSEVDPKTGIFRPPSDIKMNKPKSGAIRDWYDKAFGSPVLIQGFEKTEPFPDSQNSEARKAIVETGEPEINADWGAGTKKWKAVYKDWKTRSESLKNEAKKLEIIVDELPSEKKSNIPQSTPSQTPPLTVEKEATLSTSAMKEKLLAELNRATQSLAALQRDKRTIEEDLGLQTRRILGLLERGVPIADIMGEDPESTQPWVPDAQILAVKSEMNLVMLSVGSAQGVQPGFRFTVSRGDEYIGKVQIERVYPDMSSAKILVTMGVGKKIKLHDQAKSRIFGGDTGIGRKNPARDETSELLYIALTKLKNAFAKLDAAGGKDPILLARVATCLVDSGLISPARKFFEKALQFLPDNVASAEARKVIVLNLATLSSPRQKYGVLMNGIQALGNSGQQAEALAMIFIESVRKEYHSKALEDALSFVKDPTLRAYIYTRLAELTNKNSVELHCRRQAYSLVPNDARLHLLVTSLAKFGPKEMNQSVLLLEQHLRTHGSNARATWVWKTLGSFYRKQGNLTAALRALTQDVALHPHEAKPHYQLGSTLYQAGDKESALREIQIACRLRPEDLFQFQKLLSIAQECKNRKVEEWTLLQMLQRNWRSEDRTIHKTAEKRLKQMIKAHKKAGKPQQAKDLEQKVKAARSTDLVVKLTWDTSADIDLHVIEPGKHAVNYNQKRSFRVGLLDHDDTTGFGPETYTLKRTSSGEYKIKLNFFAGKEVTQATVKVTRFKDMPNEESKTYTVYLKKVRDEVEVLKFNVRQITPPLQGSKIK